MPNLCAANFSRASMFHFSAAATDMHAAAAMQQATPPANITFVFVVAMLFPFPNEISSPFFSVILPYIFPASNLEGNVEIAVPTFLMGANKNIKGKLGP